MSNRQPSRTSVRLMPPTTESASRTVLVTPDLASSYAAVRPAGPAPMMTPRGPEASGRGRAFLSVLLTSPGIPSAVGRAEPLYRSRPSRLPLRPATGGHADYHGGGAGRGAPRRACPN